MDMVDDAPVSAVEFDLVLFDEPDRREFIEAVTVTTVSALANQQGLAVSGRPISTMSAQRVIDKVFDPVYEPIHTRASHLS